MSYTNEELEKLKEQINRKSHWEKRIENLQLQKKQLQIKAAELEEIKIKEQKDVDKLEGRSLAALFYALKGNKETILEAEKKEAYMAAVKYDTAQKELRALEEDISFCLKKLREIAELETEQERILSEKSENIKALKNEVSEELIGWEKDLSDLKKNEKELIEAIEAGKRALAQTDVIMEHLHKADDWSTWDIFGGGLISDIVKHDHLDEAQGKIEILQILLRRFQTELDDVNIRSDITVNINGFLGFADFFFDGLFVDITIKNKISDATASVQGIYSQIKSIIIKLEKNLETNQKRQATIENQIKNLILNNENTQEKRQ